MAWLLPGNKLPEPDSKEAVCLAIDNALAIHIIHSNVGKAVEQAFLYVRHDHNEDGHMSIDMSQIVQLAPRVAQELRLPMWLFDNIMQEATKFDFNGDGNLDMMEAKRLFKKVLQQKRIEIGGRKDPKVPLMSMDEAGYTVVKELGRGGQGAMYLCTKRQWMQTKNYCVKFYNKADSNAGGLEELLDEYQLMLGMSDEHIARTYACFQDRQFFYLVNEPYFGGDLTKLGKKAHEEGIAMSEAWWRPIFLQCMQGLAYLHSNGIMHCDLKEPNIMIAGGDSYARPKPVLIDFGLSAAFTANREGVCGTPGYIPPETWQCGMWFPRGDTFSMGVVFFQMVSGQVPSKNGTIVGILQHAPDGNYGRAAASTPLPWDRFPQQWPECRNLVEHMTNRDRGRRPLPAQVLTHPWFSSNADRPLPPSSLRGLVGVAGGIDVHEEVTAQLTNANDLNALQTMLEKFQRADTSGQGVVDPRVATQVLTQHGVEPSLAAKAADTGRGFVYSELATDAITAKHQFSFHFIKDLFDRLDTDKSGKLSVQELRQLLGSRAFSATDEDVQQLVAYMDTDGDGEVSFEEFAHAALEYGRIANRCEVDNSLFGALGVSGTMASMGMAVKSQGAQEPPGSLPPGSLAPGPGGMGTDGGPPDARGPGAAGFPEQEAPDPFAGSLWNLKIVVVAARGLGPRPGTASNPFCTVGVSSAEFGAFQTHVVPNTGDPTWNVEEVIPGYQPGDDLDFALLSAGEEDDIIGTASLPCERFFPHGYDSEITVIGPGTGIRGLLRLRIAVYEEATEQMVASGAFESRPPYRSGLGWGAEAPLAAAPLPVARPAALPAAQLRTSLPPASLASVPAPTRGYSVQSHAGSSALVASPPATLSGLPQVMRSSTGFSARGHPPAADDPGLPAGSTVSWGRSWTETRPATVYSTAASPVASPPYGTSYGAPVGVAPGPAYGSSVGVAAGPAYGSSVRVVPGPTYGSSVHVVPGPTYGAPLGVVPGPACGAPVGVVPGSSFAIPSSSYIGPSSSYAVPGAYPGYGSHVLPPQSYRSY